MTSGITIIIQQAPGGRMSVNHVIMGDVSLLIAANACRATADAIDRERIEAEMAAREQEGTADGVAESG